MFTGIVTHTTIVNKTLKTDKGLIITFKKPGDWQDLEIGESVITDGACLTVSRIGDHEYDCFLMPETLQKTAFGNNIPTAVNLERSLRATDRLGGHFVQGHVDGTGNVVNIDKSNGWRLYISYPVKYRSLIIPKGSITINGVSLTIADIMADKICVALIPHTLQNTTLGALHEGDKVNLEFDMIGKYVINIIGDRYATGSTS